MTSNSATTRSAHEGSSSAPLPSGDGRLPITAASSPQQCPNCASAVAQMADDARRIADLEAQIHFLTNKASAAVDKLADYEDELASLSTLPSPGFPRITLSNPDSRRSSRDVERIPVPAQIPVLAAASEKRPSVTNRFQSFLNRRASPAPAQTSAQVPVGLHPPGLANGGQSSPLDLDAQLMAERLSRIEAEESLATLQGELEELSASLFSQANEMVADERRRRAKEEDRASMWEEQAKALQERWKGAEEQASNWEDRAKDAESRAKDMEDRLRTGQQRETRNKRLEALETAVAKLGYLHEFLNREKTDHHNNVQEESRGNGFPRETKKSTALYYDRQP